MARTDKNFNEALENVLKTHGHDETIRFLIGHDRTKEEAEEYFDERFSNRFRDTEVKEENVVDALASDDVNETPADSSVQGGLKNFFGIFGKP